MSSAELPLAKYASNVVFLSFLLGSTTLFLPRTSVSTGMVQRSSADRPEHPFLMPLTLDPLRTMLWQTGGTMVVMAWWGTRLRAWWFPRAKKDGVREKGETMGQVTRMGRSLVMTILVSLLIMPLLMALGAPLDEFLPHTYLFALHLSSLLVWPVIYTFGIPSMDDKGLYSRFRLVKLLCELTAETSLEKSITYPFAGTLIGAWLGAFVIPLDWDRPWQSWPLTTTFGSTVGFILGVWTTWASSSFLSMVTEGKQLREKPEPKTKTKIKTKTR